MGRHNSNDYTPLYPSEEGHRRHCHRGARIVAVVVVVAVVFVAVVVGLYAAGKAASNNNKNTVYKYRNAAVASDVIQCSQTGKDILLAGGNAVDSAIATLLCMGLADAQSMGIGGGFFMTIYNKTLGKAITINARETAPGAANETMYNGNATASATGAMSIAVPGEIKGYWLAHQQYGHLPWADLFTPAIKMAESGFKVPASLADAFLGSKDDIMKEPSLRKVYVNKETGDVYKEHELLKLPHLAQTLKIIAQEGETAFYNGSLTDDLVADLQDIGSIITREDLLGYQALAKQPIQVTLYNGLTVFSPPPPSSGAVLSFMLNVLDGYNLTSRDLDGTDNSLHTLHRIVETFKFAYSIRMDLGDEDFYNVTGTVANLTSPEFAAHIRFKITDNMTHNVSYYGPTIYDRFTTGTAHLAIVDEEGSAVSVTSTINNKFGSKRRGIRTGILFNDEMDDFSSPNITNIFGLPPSPANFIQPGKRPLSSMCPAVIVDTNGDVRLVIGAAGGSRITTATGFVAAHELWLRESIGQAVSDLRLHDQLLPDELTYEEGFDQTLVDGLAKMGHNVVPTKLGKSIVQAVSRHDGMLYAASDFRKGGQPKGY